MDIASLIGVLLGGGLLFAAILTAEGSSLGAFVDYPSMMVVIGGAFSALLISFPLKKFLALMPMIVSRFALLKLTNQF